MEKSSEENSAFTFLQVDFESLQSINPEVIAWIQIPALDISYPVAKGTDNAYYLHHMINGETNKSGSIFMDYHNQEDFTDRNTIIYGHNMRDGSMFGTLEKYQDPGVYDVYPIVMAMKGVGASLGPQLMAEIGDVSRFTHKGA